MPEPAVYVMEKMAHGYRRMGRASGAGFYEYEDDGSRSLWSGLKAFERRSARIPVEDVRDRLLFIQSIEAVRCLDESHRIGSTNATLWCWGFPLRAAAPQPFIDRWVSRHRGAAHAIAKSYGERFAPSRRLLDLAGRDEPLRVAENVSESDAHQRSTLRDPW